MAAIIAAGGIGAASSGRAPGFICFTTAGGGQQTNRVGVTRRRRASINCGEGFAGEE
jgi:hypothetical protein